VLIAPNETFASIARQPDWVVPLVIILVVSLAAGLIFAQRVDFGAPIREAMEQNKNVTPDQADRAVRIGTAMAKVFTYASPVLSLVSLLIIASVLLLAFRLFGGEGDFRQAFSVVLYSWMPGIIKSVIVIAIVAARNVSASDLATLLRSNLAFLVTMKDHPMLFVLLSSLDVFTVWLLALLIIGLAYVSKFSKSKSAAIVISLWVVVTLFKLIGPAIRTLRG
jgi:Yip1 domain